MLKHAKGNLIDMAEQGLFDVIVHGCNCQNTMGSGIAKEIKERYRNAWEADYNYKLDVDSERPPPVMKLGSFSRTSAVRPNGMTFIIVNAYTQVNYLPRGVDHFEYESFYLILKKLEALEGILYRQPRPDNPGFRFGFPYIGMGLAGGDSTRIIAMLEDFAARVTEAGSTVTLVEFG